MNLLQLNHDELRQEIERALGGNAALESVDSPRCPACGRPTARKGLCGLCGAAQGARVIVFTSPAEEYRESGPSRAGDPYAAREAPEAAESPSLAAHLLRQIAPELAREDRAIAAHLLTALDDDGLLPGTSPREIAAYFHVTLLRVEAVRRLIQQAAPVGCGSLSAQEALQAQAGGFPNAPAAVAACLEHLEMLAGEDFLGIARTCQLDKMDVERAARFIRANLTPYPARAWWGDANPPATTRLTPDAVIRPQGDALVVEIFLPYCGQLRINPLFRQAVRETQDAETAADLRADLEQARNLVKSLRQRQTAFETLMTRLASLQREFILHGDAHLRPLTRAEMAAELGFHESTISRAVAGKAVQVPNGHIVPLAHFFEKNRSVRAALKSLVMHESAPLSDDELAEKLNDLGYPVARRTVAKYRSMEGILPAGRRKTALAKL